MIPVRAGWDGVESIGGIIDRIDWPDGEWWWITGYDRLTVDGLADDLADGETFTNEGGITWTRYGTEMLVVTPGSRRKLAA